MHFNHFLLKCIALFNFLFIFYSHSFCQDERSSDDLFLQARKDAFERKDYNSAIQLCRKALLKSPDYSDIRIFLGRIYVWTDHLDSALYHLNYVLHQNPANEEALSALIDLEYWNGHSDNLATPGARVAIDHARCLWASLQAQRRRRRTLSRAARG